MSLILQILGLFLGVFVRTYLPYIRKLKDGKIKKFDKKYLWTAFYSIILSFVSLMFILPDYPLKELANINLVEGIKIFCTSFTFGFTWNSVLNETESFRNKKFIKK
jgi:hypothetical protein